LSHHKHDFFYLAEIQVHQEASASIPIISAVALANALYSASVHERETVAYFLALL
jgi:hypothetical protein